MLACAVVSPALAQDLSGEVALGYNYLRDSEYGRDYAAGFFVGLGVQPHPRLAIVLEAAQSSTSDTLSYERLQLFQMGPRVRLFPRRGPVAAYVQFLFGVSRSGEKMRSQGYGWYYRSHLLLQPALGLDVALTGHFALRAGVGMPFIAYKSTHCAICAEYTDWDRYPRVYLGVVAFSKSVK